MTGVPFAPPEASNFAREIDALFYALLAFSFALGLFLTVLVIRYAIKYRRGSGANRQGKRMRNLPLEVAWTSSSLVVGIVLFGWGAELYMQRFHPPTNALHILGVGKQWMWKFQHPGGQREIDELHVPVDEPVIVELASEDVIHSFFVPAFRVKQDAVPGMSTNVWFTATKAGTYDLFCAEFCGTAHSAMAGNLVAMTPQDYAAWLEKQPTVDSPVAEGAALYRALGCSGCHEGRGAVRAPDLRNIFGHPVALANSSTTIADTAYIRDSILDPDKQIAAGYAPIMPAFAGLIGESELMDLVAYIESLSDKGAPS
ncbi:MAG TPA: cytochrome c oxidase subunit II [Bauldia sp.]|nr:cytochrome c oxidase subunit II [Bauldia sp.]